MWGDCSACRVRFAKAMEMCHPVSADNTQSETRNARVLHLSIHIPINLCKIGSGFRLHTWCSLNRKHQPWECTSRQNKKALKRVR